MTLKRFIAAYIAYLLLSAAFARKALVWLRGITGPNGIQVITWALLLGTLTLVFLLVRKNQVSWFRTFLILLTFAGIFLFLKGMRNPDERIHLFQYGLLGFLLVHARRDEPMWRTVGVALVIVLLVACADEAFQAFLPDRVGDIRDVGFGGLGGTWGATVAALATKVEQRT